MDTVRGILNWAFPYVLYPLVVIGVFVVIGDMLRMLVAAASDRLGKIRRVTGAILPWVILVFLFTVDPTVVDSLRPLIAKLNWLAQLIIGAIIGVLMMEFGKLLMKAEGDGPASLYALVMSGFGAFLVLLIMKGILQSVNFALMGLVVAGAIHVIFRGPPEVDRTKSSGPDRRERV
jgi:hypothetical protein